MGKVFSADRMLKMTDAKPHLKTLEEIEQTCVPGLVERSCALRASRASVTPCGT